LASSKIKFPIFYKILHKKSKTKRLCDLAKEIPLLKAVFALQMRSYNVFAETKGASSKDLVKNGV
jgi:hypothetical protein